MYADLYYDKPKSWWIHFFEDEMKWKLPSEIKPPLQTALELWFYMPTIKIFSFFSFYCILEEIDKKLKISTIQLSVLYRVSLSKSYLVEFWCVWTSCKGQIISECLLGVENFPNNHRKIWQISAQETKKWSNQQNKGTFT